MIRQSTIDKLHDLKLSAMSDAFEAQSNDRAFHQLSFEDRFGMLVDREWDKRKNSKLQKMIQVANFRYPNACMEDIEYHADRKLAKSQLLELSTCKYIVDNHHIILKGASGSGKTFIASALGIAACRNLIKVRYIRLPDLLNDLTVAHGEGTFEKVIKAYQKVDLLILDEFLLSPVLSNQARELLEIIEARSVKGSVIFCTQFEPGDWYGRIGNEFDATISESIIDRVIHNSHEIMIEGRISMRERHGLKSSLKRGGSID
jgi:DNA replication protein DnaC